MVAWGMGSILILSYVRYIVVSWTFECDDAVMERPKFHVIFPSTQPSAEQSKMQAWEGRARCAMC